MEQQAIEMALEDFARASVKQQHKRAKIAIRALRMEVLRFLLGGISFGHLARSLGSSDLLADFCRVRDLEGIKGISKSRLPRGEDSYKVSFNGLPAPPTGGPESRAERCLSLRL